MLEDEQMTCAIYHFINGKLSLIGTLLKSVISKVKRSSFIKKLTQLQFHKLE